MNRRSFLCTATVGLVAGAGCTGSQVSEETTTRTTTTTKLSTTTTKTTTSSTTSTTATTSTTSTTEETTAASEIADTKIRKAKSLLAETLTTYAEFSGSMNVTIATVTAATTTFDDSAITEKVSKIQSLLTNAEARATEKQEKTIRKLREISKFLRYAALTQTELISAYKEVKKANEAFREARWGRVNEYGRKAKQSGVSADRFAHTTANKSSLESTTALQELSKSTYENKIAQLQNQAIALKKLGKQFQRLQTAVTNYNQGVTAYNDEDYRHANDPFERAKKKFETIIKAIKSQKQRAPIGGIYGDVKCFSAALLSACKHFEKAAETEDSETRQEEERRGNEALESCAVVQDIVGEVN